MLMSYSNFSHGAIKDDSYYKILISKIFNTNLKKIKKNELTEVSKYFKKQKNFKDYSLWAKNLEVIIKSKSLSLKIKNCSEIDTEISLSFLIDNISKKCANYLKKNLKEISLTDSQKAVELFLKWPQIYLFKADKKEKDFLNKISKTEHGQHFKSAILDIFLTDKKTPSPEFSSSFLNDSRFKKMHTLLGDRSTQKEKEALRSLKRKIKPLYDSGGSSKFESVFKKKYSLIPKNLEEKKFLLDRKNTIKEMFNLLAFLARNKKNKESRALLEILDTYTSIEQKRADAHFYYLWSYLQDGDLKQAEKYIKDKHILENFEKFPSRLQFWTAKILKKSKGEDFKNSLLVKLIKSNPISYYGSVAALELKEKDQKSYKEVENFYLKPSLSTYSQTDYLNFSTLASSTLERANQWSKLSANTLLFNEVNELIEKNEGSFDSFTKLISLKLHENGLFLHTFRLLYQKMEAKEISYDKDLLYALFPSPYKKEIEGLTASIDSKIIMSLIRQESSFNPFARSPVGALGLMQMMPYTAKRFDKKITKEKLKDYKTNLKLGLTYFIELNDRYKGNLTSILSAYNAGERRIDNWRKTYLISTNPLVNIEHIPFNETRQYVKLISRNKFFYSLIEKDLKSTRSLASKPSKNKK